MNDQETYLKILSDELIPAMGCTEPIALAYCSALARQILGSLPDRVVVEVSGNIIKNVKSVVVPNTDHMRGLPAAVAIGVVAGRPERKLEVISEVTTEQIVQMRGYIRTADIQIGLAPSRLTFDMIVCAYKDGDFAKVRIAKHHTNVVYIEKNGQILKNIPVEDTESDANDLRRALTIEKIYRFANEIDLDKIRPLLERQIQYNTAIAEEGIQNSYGANIGSTLLETYQPILAQGGEPALRIRATAMAAAGSDARMSGCEMPVIINSGSGNQGITVCVPVVVYARQMKASEEKLYRALTLANLIAIYQRAPIGTLSAYCGAVNAGVAAVCGVAYLKGADYNTISHLLVNALAIISGVVCDGAKPSCAGKIAMAIECGFLGYDMYLQGNQFVAGDGIVKKGVENNIQSVGRLGRVGMAGTDREILSIMLEE